mmetsp:Transcript_8983/g.22046  ORF Transcript_8983/g.22046 Transcript_8983/m.22046 type:complete len:211 (-) Transcript_8983:31-663(-)
MSRRRPPTFMPVRPMSHPLTTSPRCTVKVKWCGAGTIHDNTVKSTLGQGVVHRDATFLGGRWYGVRSGADGHVLDLDAVLQRGEPRRGVVTAVSDLVEHFFRNGVVLVDLMEHLVSRCLLFQRSDVAGFGLFLLLLLLVVLLWRLIVQLPIPFALLSLLVLGAFLLQQFLKELLVVVLFLFLSLSLPTQRRIHLGQFSFPSQLFLALGGL